MNLIEKVKLLFFKSKNLGENKNRETLSSKKFMGTVSHFDHSRGYGFIYSAEFDHRVFLHISEVEVKIKKGHKVKFDAEKNRKGWKAINVEVEGFW